jgi:hypothetical protein
MLNSSKKENSETENVLHVQAALATPTVRDAEKTKKDMRRRDVHKYKYVGGEKMIKIT